MELPASITNFIDSLGDVEHDRLLTTKLVANHIFMPVGEIAGCLVGVARGCCEGMEEEWDCMKRGRHGHAAAVANMERGDWDEWADWKGDRPWEHQWQAFNRLASADRDGTENAIRAYIRGLRATRAVIEEITAPAEEVAVTSV